MIEWGSRHESLRRRARGRSASPPGVREDGPEPDGEPRLVSESEDAGRNGRDVRLPFREVERGEVVERDARDRLVWAFNALVASVALVLLSPVMLLIALAIKLDSQGPVLYRQLRVGLDRRGLERDEDGDRRTTDLGGQPFMLYKFRTMHVDAEAETGPVWCSDDDDRVTRVGRFLREHRLDELPQLWNVLRGEMSVVGPRPERPSLVSYLRDEIDVYPLRQKVLPGITGWAQVNLESDQTIDDVRSKLRYDLEYLQERSLMFDLRIMARTVPVMLERDRLERPDGGRQNGRDSELTSASAVRT